MRFIDLFAGIGGFRLGLERANKRLEGDRQEVVCISDRREAVNSSGIGDIQTERPSRCSINITYPKGFRCVWSCDIDKYCEQVYKKNFKEGFDCHDITTYDVSRIPDHELLCAGFPCQSFSIAGKRRGFEDARGTLFFEICRVLRAKRTPYILLENVKGLLSHDEGATFLSILRYLDEMGYGYQWEVLNSKNFGVPQNRERVFIVGHLRGQPQPQVFPLGEDVARTNEGTDDSTDIRTLQGGGHSGGHHSGMTIIDIYNKGLRANQDLAGALKGEGIANTSLGTALVYHENKSGQRTPHKEAQALRSGASHNYQTLEIANALDADGYLRTGARPRDKDGKPQLLPIGYRRIRRLTPIECERLQGFPDGWTEGVSDTQRYKMLGNAVTVNVVEAIGERL